MAGYSTFEKPKDITQWFSVPHCGPGTTDTTECCGFCGRNVLECAKLTTQSVKEHPEWKHDGGIIGDGEDDPEKQMTCGGCGFWCSACGRFWAQSSCGDNFPGDMASADDKKQVIKDGKVFCVCGQQLATVRKDQE